MKDFDPDLTGINVIEEEEETSPFGSKKRMGILLCYPFEEKRLNNWGSTVLVQPKLDGERCRAIFNSEGKVILLSSECNPITSVPHIVKELESYNFRNLELDGELYIHGKPFEEIHSRVSRKVNIHPDFDEVNYHIFDMVNDLPQWHRLITLKNLEIEEDVIKVVPTVSANTVEDVMRWLDIYKKDGYEGIIVRNLYGRYKRARSTDIMKFKPRKSDSYKIVGFQQEVDKYGVPKQSLGAFICEDDMKTQFKVGSGFTADQRRDWWPIRYTILGKFVEVKYQHLTPGKRVPRFPVFVEVK